MHERRSDKECAGGEGPSLQVENSGEDEVAVSRKKGSSSKKASRRNVGVQVSLGGTAGCFGTNVEQQVLTRLSGIREEASPMVACNSVMEDNFFRDAAAAQAGSSSAAGASAAFFSDQGVVPSFLCPPVSVNLGAAERTIDPLEIFTPVPFASPETGTCEATAGDLKKSPALSARNRWRQLRNTVAFTNHIANVRAASSDLLENRVEDGASPEEDAAGVGPAAFEGAATAAARWRPRGRKGMESMVVRQEKCVLSYFQDFYVACLKMPIGHFLIGVFVAPLALGLLFTPLYLMDLGGLNFEGATSQEPNGMPPPSAKQRWFFAAVNVFLYALSLSTTFGGSPVTAFSPFCLLVANVNTLMAQFLFVFLSGAVFARMSQPSHPVRCSKMAVIREGDFVPASDDSKDRFRVLAVRLVLTGPPPCELVDAKICLIFRIFIKLPTGSMFCSTQNLNLLRSEVSYLRYGIMVRHVIDKESPVYGYTMETLREGDASFSLTIMALERTSMQPIFHLEDYFVHDNDVVWDGDYEDFISLNANGQRVLDHSKIDCLKPFKVAGIVAQAISRMEGNVVKRKEGESNQTKQSSLDAAASEKVDADGHGGSTAQSQVPMNLDSPLQKKVLTTWISGIRNRRLFEAKSTSFTRAPGYGDELKTVHTH